MRYFFITTFFNKFYYFACSLIIFLPVFTGIRSIFGIPFYLPLISIIAIYCRPLLFNLPKSYVVILLIGLVLNFASSESFAVVGRFLIEPILLFYIFHSLHVKKKLLDVIKYFIYVLLLIYLFFAFYPNEMDSLRASLILFNNMQLLNDTIFSESSIMDSIYSRIDGYTALSATSLLLLPTLLVFLVAFQKYSSKSFFFSASIILLIIAINERLSFIFIFFYLLRNTRYLVYIFSGILGIYIVFSFVFWQFDFRLGTPYFTLKYGDILRFTNLGEYPSEWMRVSSLVNLEITDIITGDEKLIGIHNHLFSLPILYGFLGVLLFFSVIIYLLMVYRLFHRQPGFRFIFCALLINMLFHNDGILFMPIYYSLLYAIYYDDNKTARIREIGANISVT